MNSWIIRYGELALKGQNRYEFENALINNVRSYLKKYNKGYSKITKSPGRILLYSKSDCSILKNVFGITSLSPAIECQPSIKDIQDVIFGFFLKKIKDKKNFRVSTKRINKNGQLTSNEINRKIGNFIVAKTQKKVKLKDFDYEIGIEIIQNKAYIFDRRIKCFGGLPIGTQGRAYCLVEDKSSLLASWLMMKRGCDIVPVAFKKIKIDLLNKYHPNKLNLKLIKSLQELESNKALVVKDTLPSLCQYAYKGLVLRPLITYSEDKIGQELRSL